MPPTTLTLRAWISRRKKHGTFQSNIRHLGHHPRKATHTRNRTAALDFNLLHLKQTLKQKP